MKMGTHPDYYHHPQRKEWEILGQKIEAAFPNKLISSHDFYPDRAYTDIRELAETALPGANFQGKMAVVIGPGIGMEVRVLIGLGMRAKGIEANPDAVRVSIGYGVLKPDQIQTGKIEDYLKETPPESIDIIMGHAIEPLFNTQPVLIEARRVLRHGGALILCGDMNDTVIPQEIASDQEIETRVTKGSIDNNFDTTIVLLKQ